MQETLVIGTRGSALALRQSEIVKKALEQVAPTLQIETRVITTTGDQNQNPIPLDTIGKGWFTKEIEEALRTGSIHLAVHSLKDMAEDMPEDLVIGAYLPREDARDVLITKDGRRFEDLPEGARIGTDSTRRSIQVRALRKDLTVVSMRGNVPTRIEKLHTENYDAIIIALAGLKRLGREKDATRVFTPEEMTPAPGQGILAVQTTRAHHSVLQLLEKVNDLSATDAATLERSLSQALGGGCKAPVGALAENQGGHWTLLGMIGNTDTGALVRETSTIHLPTKSESIKVLAESLLKTLDAA